MKGQTAIDAQAGRERDTCSSFARLPVAPGRMPLGWADEGGSRIGEVEGDGDVERRGERRRWRGGEDGG